MDETFVYLCLFSIGLLITFLIIKAIIRAAIDNSKTSEEIAEIRRLLELLVEKNGVVLGDSKEDELKNLEIMDTPFDTCPACGEKLSPDDEACPACGISLPKNK